MPMMMLTCSNIHTFPSGLSIEGDIQDLQLYNNYSQCPICGEMTRWPDGRFNMIKGVLEYIYSTDNPKETVEALLDQAQSGDIKQIPFLQKIMPNTTEKVNTYIAILGLIITLMTINDNKVTPHEVMTQYNTTVNIQINN